MAINQSQQDVVANNLANVDTVGFKRDLAVFQQRLQQAQSVNRFSVPQNLRDATGGAFVADIQTDYRTGTIENTGRNLDIALDGPGFLMVKNGENTCYTRDGRLAVQNDKLVRETDGKAVLDENGNEIILPTGLALRDLHIDDSGRILVKNQSVAKLGVVEFDQVQNLRKLGGNLYEGSNQSCRASQTNVKSGEIENSTVNPATELVDMLRISRNYQLNAQMITIQDQSLGRLVNELPKL